MRALLRISWLNLHRDRAALLLTFALPIAFFSVFAIVLGGAGGGSTARVRIAIADLDRSETSERFVAALERDPSLRVRTRDDAEQPFDRDGAIGLVQNGTLPVAVIILPGFGEAVGSFAGETALELAVDRADPIAGPMVSGLLQRAVFTAMPDVLAVRGLESFDAAGGALTDHQRALMDRMGPLMRGAAEGQPQPPAEADPEPDPKPDSQAATEAPTETPTAANPMATGLVPMRTIDVLGASRRGGVIAFYAAGTAVMFLLFSMVGAAGTLLEEEETGTLERLLGTGMGMGTLISARWVFHALIGVVQITVMFLWGTFAFGLELFSHLLGFTVMTIATAFSAAAFGLAVATVCRTRAQLTGFATVLILIMSAVGGSMFPRFMMPEWMQTVGLVTFNAWALDGYQKVFWYGQATHTLWPQVTVLAAITAACLLTARLLGRRWERA